MADKESMSRILELCLGLERQALHLYGELAVRADEEAKRQLWQAMARDEAGHMAYWHRLLEMNREGAIPEIFDDPAATEAFLRDLQPKIRQLFRDACDGDYETQLLLALRLEFYLLDPQFQSLFHCLYNLPDRETPEEDYETHLRRLLDALRRFEGDSPAMVLLHETFERLWQSNRQAIRFALIDHLTGVHNRRGLFAAINPLLYLARRNTQPVGAMMVDVDNFKKVNDTFGHPAGDRVLAQVAQRLRSRLRGSDIIGRYGGEEFLVVMTPVDPAHLKEIAESLRRSIAEAPIDEVKVTVSIGLSYAIPGKDVEKGLEQLLHRADQALLEAKRNGKNRVVVWRGEAEPDDWISSGLDNPGPPPQA